jgi:phosphoribosyl 1,2-cyclic phosphate phosphodiesterase
MEKQKLHITILGSGTSQGVPVIACDCEVCSSMDPRDNRLRSSVLISHGNKNYVIDTGPDFRQQMLNTGIKNLNAIIYTHEHKDHLAGMDDIRAFNYRSQEPMRIFCDDRVEEALRKEYAYVFSEERYPGIPSVEFHKIRNSPFQIDDLLFTPIEVMHYRLPVFGYRIGDFVYITDAKTISEDEKRKVLNAKVLVINALHRSKHISHFNLEEALEFIAEVKPEKAYLTHISHLFGKHDEIQRELPPNVSLAYDGLEFEIE